MDDQARKSAPNLVGDLVGNVSELVRKEIQLLRAEMSEKTTQAFTAAGMIVSGIVIVLVALIVLTFALVAALANAGMGPGWSALLVGVGYTIFASMLISKGVKDLKASNLAPDRTATSLSRDANMVKEKTS